MTAANTGCYCIKRRGDVYLVLNSRGVQVGAPKGNRDDALTFIGVQLDKGKLSQRKPRACMCCGVEFLSEGIHHRLCNRCRRQSEAMV